MPACLRIFSILSSLLVSMPDTITVPSSGRLSAFISFAKVDLPEPLCPSTHTNEPFSMLTLSSERAVCVSITLSASSCTVYLYMTLAASIMFMPAYLLYLGYNQVYSVACGCGFHCLYELLPCLPKPVHAVKE